MTFTNSISSIVNTTNNDTSGLKLLEVENVHDIIWIPPSEDSRSNMQAVITAEWKVSYTLVYE
jgi:hypothetical protein